MNLVVPKEAPASTAGSLVNYLSNTYVHNVKSISLEEGVTNFGIIDGCLYDIASGTLITSPYGITSITASNAITAISGYAFCNCSSLTSITGISAITTIGEGAFLGCSALTSFTFPSTLTSIGKRAFQESGLTEATIPESVDKVDEYAFYNCTSLVTVWDGALKHGGQAFSNCSALESLFFSRALGGNSFGGGAVNNCPSLTYIRVSNGLGDRLAGSIQYCPKIKTAGPESGDYNFEYPWTTNISGGNYGLHLEALQEVTFPATTTQISNYCMHSSGRNVTKIYCYAMTAPSVGAYAFSTLSDNTKAAGLNELHVPVGATGYESGGWANLVNNKGYTLYYDL